MSRIDEIKARAEAATPGPWDVEARIDEDYEWDICEDPYPTLFNAETDKLLSVSDNRFLNHARDDIPYLLSEVERLQNALKNLRSLLQGSDFSGREQVEQMIAQALAQKENRHFEEC